jgi:hypothetical protein
MKIDYLRIGLTALITLAAIVCALINISHWGEEQYQGLLFLTAMAIIGFWQVYDWIMSFQKILLRYTKNESL